MKEYIFLGKGEIDCMFCVFLHGGQSLIKFVSEIIWKIPFSTPSAGADQIQSFANIITQMTKKKNNRSSSMRQKYTFLLHSMFIL
jgi:hypothetical protein